jgi:simple sugar transport system ATP-binding protein
MTDVTNVSVPVLKLEKLTKRFGGVTAVDGASLELHQGEVVAIVGDNGAGKSTLMKMIAGVYTPTSGRVLLDGEETHFSGPGDSRSAGIEVVYQDLALALGQSVYMNMFLGRELVRGPFRLLDKRRMKAEAQAILDELKVRVPSVSATIKHMSGGQRQGVAIGRATHWAKRVVLLDEPTAALGVQETARVESAIRSLRERGLAVILVSHNLDQVFRLSQRIYVLRRGAVVAERSTSEVTGDQIVALITGAVAEAPAQS